MNWVVVEIEYADEETVAHTANAMIEILVKMKRVKSPSDSEVWAVRKDFAHLEYYISPGLARAAAGHLRQFNIKYLVMPPSLTNALRIRLR